MFHDLCVSVQSSSKERDVAIGRLLELGYSSVAWNTTSPAKFVLNTKPLQPVSINTKLLNSIRKSRKLSDIPPLQSKLDVKQYSRLTVVVEDVTDSQALTTGNPALMKYDIIAGSPRSFSAFAHLCKQAEVDIISLDFSRKLPFQIDQKHVSFAMKRGILFEISYACAIQGSAQRRQLLEGTRVVVEYLKGKQFVFSSDSDGIAQFRSPHDVMNIACIIGLPEDQARRSTSGNCDLVLQHAYSRKLRYTSVEILSRIEFMKKWSYLDHLLGPNSQRKVKEGAEPMEEAVDSDTCVDESGDDDSFTASLVETHNSGLYVENSDTSASGKECELDEKEDEEEIKYHSISEQNDGLDSDSSSNPDVDYIVSLDNKLKNIDNSEDFLSFTTSGKVKKIIRTPPDTTVLSSRDVKRKFEKSNSKKGSLANLKKKSKIK